MFVNWTIKDNFPTLASDPALVSELVSRFLTISITYPAHLKGRQNLAHLNQALLGLSHVYWETLRHADR